MIHKIDEFRKIFCMIYDVLFFTLITYFFQRVFLNTNINLIPLFSLFFVFAFSDICIEKSTGLFFLCVPQLILCALIFVMPIDAGSRYILAAIAAFKLASSVMYVKNGMKIRTVDEAPWVTTVIALIIYAFGSYLKDTQLIKSSYVLMLVIIVIFFIRLYLQGLNSYVNSAKDVSGLPLEKIVSVNNVVIAGILAFFLLVVLLFGLFDFHGLITLLFGILKGLFVMLLAGVRYIIKLISLLMFKTDGDSGQDELDFYYAPAEDNTSRLADFIEMLVKLGILAVVIYLVYSGLKRLVAVMMKRRLEPDDTVETADRYETEEIRPEAKVRARRESSLPDVRLRRLYKNFVKKNGDEIGLRSSCTCGDIKERLYEKQELDISEATRLYQQVRYGEKQTDRKMLKDMSTMLKNTSRGNKA